MKEEALKLAEDLEYTSTLGYPSKLEQQNAIAMIRRLVEELDKWKEEAIDQQQLAIEYRKLYEEETPQTKQEHCCPDCGCHFVGEFPFNYAPQTNPLQQIIDDIDCLENEINRLKYDKNIYAPNRIDYLQNKLNDMQQKLKEY